MYTEINAYKIASLFCTFDPIDHRMTIIVAIPRKLYIYNIYAFLSAIISDVNIGQCFLQHVR